MQPFLLGYGLAIVIGVPLGLVIGRFWIAEAALGILVTGGYAMPLVALVPLLVLWFGLGFAVKAAVIFLMSVFPICINTWLGVKSVPKTLIDVGKSLVAPNSVILRRIVLPATLPYVMAGIKLAVGRAVVGMVIAEFFTSISGLGAIIINSANNFDTATMFVPIIILMVLAVGLNALLGWFERIVAPWQDEIAGRKLKNCCQVTPTAPWWRAARLRPGFRTWPRRSRARSPAACWCRASRRSRNRRWRSPARGRRSWRAA